MSSLPLRSNAAPPTSIKPKLGRSILYLCGIASAAITGFFSRLVLSLTYKFYPVQHTPEQNLVLANELAELSGSIQKKNTEILLLNKKLAQRIGQVEAQKKILREEKEKIENLTAELKIEMRTDALTKITNRRGFDEAIAREWSRASRLKMPLSLIFCDVDFFKLFNDRYGHLEGDRCLIEVANCLKAVGNRATDVVARYGGEEFAILLPDIDIEQAAYVAERARLRLLDMGLEHQGSSFGTVTASFGVASLVPPVGVRPTEFIAAADQTLYRAKALGRNRVVKHNEGLPLGS